MNIYNIFTKLWQLITPNLYLIHTLHVQSHSANNILLLTYKTP